MSADSKAASVPDELVLDNETAGWALREIGRLRRENAALREAGEALYMLHLTGAGESGEFEIWASLNDPEVDR